ncbi:MAG: hypothetical protein ACYCYI_09975 [Saccharofermentanales bacterium]
MLLIVAIVLPIIFAFPVFAGVTGTEGGSCISSDYDISAGGSVKIYYSSSKDAVLVGTTKPTGSKTVDGPATGQYPVVADMNDAYVAQGWVAIDNMKINPAEGFSVDDVIVDGKSKGAVSSYEFDPNLDAAADVRKHTIVVKFKTGTTAKTKTSCFFWLILILLIILIIFFLILFFILLLRKSRKKREEDEETEIEEGEKEKEEKK